MPPSPVRPRSVRVFVSSTFRDMHGEREELVKRVFPQLRKVCEQRGVAWGEVDLRWGITDEEKAEGAVLPRCLAEIDRCRPFFLGILGERYGWAPDDIPAGLLEREPWLAGCRGRSVTELEVLHGALNHPGRAEAFFYFRDPESVDPGPGAPEPGEGRARLAALKGRVRGSGFPVREDYAGPQDLARLVLADLTAVIDRLYPPGAAPDPLDGEASCHEAFAARRGRAYVGREEDFAALDAHAGGSGLPLVVVGEPGVGKSALLANWARRAGAADPPTGDGPLFLLHFVGASPASTDWAAMLRRALGELARRLDLRAPVPAEDGALRAAFANALHLAAARRRVVLVLDGLDQLDDRDGAPDLTWLPPIIPPNVRLILSTLPGRPLDELARRGWPTLRVLPLGPDDRARLVTRYLAEHAKALGPARAARIVAAGPTGNPLFLTVLLEELRVYGDHFTLDRRIDDCLGAATVEELYGMILGRYEQDYDRDRPGLVRDAMTLLGSARRGLSEAELLDLLGDESGPLPQAHWSPLHLAAEHALLDRAGLIAFAHEQLRSAVVRKYLPGEEDRRQAHLRLAFYFAARSAGEMAGLAGRPVASSPALTRCVDEVLWQDARAEDCWRLHLLLSMPIVTQVAWAVSPSDVKGYWALLEEKSEYRMVDTYRPLLDDPSAHAVPELLAVAVLLTEAGHAAEALRLWAHLGGQPGPEEETPDRAGMLVGSAISLGLLGRSDEALALLRRAEESFRRSGERIGLADALHTRAQLLSARGDPDGAAALCDEHEAIAAELQDDRIRAYSLSLRSQLLWRKGRIDRALLLAREAEDLCRRLNDKALLARCLGDRAGLLYLSGESEKALALNEEEEQAFRELGDPMGLVVALSKRAALLADRDERDEALRASDEVDALCRRYGFRRRLAESLSARATLLLKMNRPGEADACTAEAEQLCREMGLSLLLAHVVHNRAVVLSSRGDEDGAAAASRQAEQLARESGDKETLAQSLLFQAHRGGPDDPRSAAMLDEAEKILRGTGNKSQLATCLAARADLLESRGDLAGACERLAEVVRLRRERGEREGLASALASQARLLERRGELAEAAASYKAAARVFRDLGRVAGEIGCLGAQAGIARRGGDLDEALGLYLQMEKVARAADDQRGLLLSVGEQGEILYAQHEGDKALPLYAEAERISRALGEGQSLQARLGDQAEILLARGEVARAAPLIQEMERVCLEVGNKGGWARARMLWASVLEARGEREQAIPLYRELVAALADGGERRDLATVQMCLATLLAQRDPGESGGLLDEAEQSFRELRDDSKLKQCREVRNLLVDRGAHRPSATSWVGRAWRTVRNLLTGRGTRRGAGPEDAARANELAMAAHDRYQRRDLAGARSLGEQEEALWRRLGNRERLAGALGFVGAVLLEQGDARAAMKRFAEKEQICRELGDRKGLAACLLSRADILTGRGDLDDALGALEECAKVCRELQDERGLMTALTKSGLILKQQGKREEYLSVSLQAIQERAAMRHRRGDLEGAAADLDGLEQIAREGGLHGVLKWALGLRALVLRDRGDVAGAAAALGEIVRVFRRANDPEELVEAMIFVSAVMAQELGRPREALPLLEEAHRLAAGSDLAELADKTRNMLAYLQTLV